MLTGAMFMLEIYDRVLPSRSVPTLVGIAILAGGLYVVQGILDLIRGRLLVRVGSALDLNHGTAPQDMTKVQLPHHQGDFHFA